MASAKPVIHGPDHRPGGADPITGIGGLQYHEGTYGAFNLGDWLNSTTTGYNPDDFHSVFFNVTGDGDFTIQNDGTAGTWIFDNGGGGITISDAGAGDVLIRSQGGDITVEANNSDGEILVQNVNDDHGIEIKSTGSNGNVALTTTGSSGDINVYAVRGGVSVRTDTTGAALTLLATAGAITIESLEGGTAASVNVRINDGCYFSVFNPTLTEWLRVGSGGIFMFNLPTSNPGGSGQLWNSSGTVKIT